MNDDETLRLQLAEAVSAAGAVLRDRFRADARPADPDAIWAALHANDEASLAVLLPALTAIRPGARMVDDELESAPPPAGEWWVVDPAEGNINHVHGLPDWCVTATLVRDGVPVVTAVSFPLEGRTPSARAGGGAWADGRPLAVSAKTDLGGASVGTAQAAPGEPAETLTRISRSVDAMLRGAMLVRVAVPATVGLVAVAEGHQDAFWQHSAVMSGLAAGALLVAEAGGTVTDLAGRPWTPGSPDLLAAAPGVHGAARGRLADLAVSAR